MEAILDYRGVTPHKSASGIPLITAKIIKGGALLPATEFIPVEDYESWMRRGLPSTGDVVMTTEAPLGEVAQLDGRKVALGQRTITMRGKRGILDNTYLKFAIMSPLVQNQLRERSTGTTVLGIKQRELRRVLLPLPSYDEQRGIAGVLGSLDDRIELAHRINETLAQIASSLFRSWFIDFDPVRAKAEGQQPFGLDAETARLFPDSFEDTELGQLPKGWERGQFGDIAVQRRCSAAPGEIGADEPYIGLEHMPRESIALGEWGRGGDVVSQKTRFCRGDVLFGKLRPYFHKVGIAPTDGVCSTDILVMNAASNDSYGQVVMTAASRAMIAFVTASSDGTRMPRTRWADLARFPIPRVPPEVGSAFTRMVEPLFDRIAHNGAENRTLSELRDTLLPVLLSGEVRVQDAEQLVEAIA